MATQNEDTDPSTPASLRPPQNPQSRRGYGLRDAAARAPVVEDPNRPTTDPGLGPASRPPGPSSVPPSSMPSSRPRGVIVPPPTGRGASAITPVGVAPVPPGTSATAALSASARGKENKDSVELLLDGMTGQRPERRRTTPQSAGEASASYHAKHGVHPPHTLAEPGPKVVVERASAPPAAEPRPAPRAQASGADDTTVVPPRPVGRRVATAVLTALLIVLALFVGMDLVSGRAHPTAPVAQTPPVEPRAVAAPAPAPLPVPVTAPVTKPVTNEIAIPEPTAQAASAPVAPAGEATAEKPAPSVQASGPRRRHHPGSAGGDLGEFKSTF